MCVCVCVLHECVYVCVCVYMSVHAHVGLVTRYVCGHACVLLSLPSQLPITTLYSLLFTVITYFMIGEGTILAAWILYVCLFCHAGHPKEVPCWSS